MADELQGMENVMRALTSFETGVDAYKMIDVQDAINLAADDSTPLTRRIRREKLAHTTLFEWLEQYLPAIGTNAQAEGTDPSPSASNKPTRLNNTMQILAKTFEITDTMERIARAGGLIGVQGSELARQFSMQMTLLFQEQEYYLLNGVQSTSDPRQMKGLLNWVLSGNKVDVAAAQITPANVKGFINQAIAKVINAKGGVRPNAIYCAPGFADVLAEAAGSNVQVTVDLATYQSASPMGVVGSNVGWFKSNYGILEVVMTPFLTAATSAPGAATSNVLLVNEKSLTIVDYINGGIEVADRAKTDAKIKRVATEEITLKVDNLRAHALVNNFYI